MANNDRVTKAKEEVEIQRIYRDAKLNALGDYVGFWSVKIAGAGAAVFGAVDLVNPTFFHVHAASPQTVLVCGLSLLTGRNVISKIKTIASAL